ncbi:MAG: hypothetical protein JOY54_09155 [Acidobacteriaceae bacterium]|nr:hypothetical protein [Acidobacteriaceae bacterium]
MEPDQAAKQFAVRPPSAVLISVYFRSSSKRADVTLWVRFRSLCLMIRLLLFAPCERALINQEDSSASLINVVTGVQAALPFPEDQPLPENAALPFRWYLLSIWRYDGEDIGRRFQQRVALVAPSGKELIAADLTFQAATAPPQVVRGITCFTTFPVAELGEHSARLFYRQSEDADWEEVASYPIDVLRGPVIDPSKPPEPAS